MTRVQPPPPFDELFNRLIQTPERLIAIVRMDGQAAAPDGKYRHWDTLRHLQPPDGLTPEEWWLRVKTARRPILRPIPLTDALGKSFKYCLPDRALELLHSIDQRASGEIRTPELVFQTDAARRQYLVNSMIEEAIRSSQLEGASTTRKVAKEMIRSGRKPRDRSERMILNNYNAMQFMDSEMKDQELTPESVLALQRILTEGTLANPDAAGRLQRPDEERVQVWDTEQRLLHDPPPADQLEERMKLFCAFANAKDSDEAFIHPVIRSVIIHFWLAYDHPFEDGNGRTARTIFYWSMLRREYWLTEYLSISRILREGPSKYYRAFLKTETDEGDLTYFILFHLEVIHRAIEELYQRVVQQMEQMREFEDLVASKKHNFRQMALLKNAVMNSGALYTYQSHARSHGVSFQTARTDLLELRKKRLLVMKRVGNRHTFSPADDLRDRLVTKT